MFDLYDVAIIDSNYNFKIIQVFAMSEIDALNTKKLLNL